MSVQLEALADEVFEAAGTQARMGAETVRLPEGEAYWHRRYPDLFFMNGIARLVAPAWSVQDFERAVQETMPGVRAVRAYSRDPATIAQLGSALSTAGYAHERRVGMVQTSKIPDRTATPYRLAHIPEQASWSAFEESIAIDAGEHEWTQAMISQFIDLCHWSAANTAERYYLAFDAARAVGHVALFQHRTTGYLHALYTHGDSRRHGVGRALTLGMTAEAANVGCDRLTLQCIDDGYLPGYYARLGFRAVGEQHMWSKQQ